MAAELPIIPRALALRDVDEALAHYLQQASVPVALGFVDALEQAYTHLSRAPATGSPRYAHALNLPGLRSWPLSGYPYLIFYIERGDHVDVWRVLQAQRDMPRWLD